MKEDSIKDLILNYEKERSLYKIEDSHKRQTFLVEEDNIKRLESLQAYLELQNARNSSLSNDDDSLRRNRKLAVGFKTKAVNIALKQFMDNWDNEIGLTPEIEVIRYKVANINKNYRVYLFEMDGQYHFVQHDNRGNELEHITGSESSIREKFESYRETEIRSGRPKN
ncbi:hypothetical protein [Macrococcus carouselicus]|uniref:Uncharacterized protein n=1 Tax=Macrococcus carouselicus TaxID=69969 RepID=A0A9Q8CNR4_9STAP|nr:hypothetical protein [Macrococcus carouselicus]TDM04077.1 hypothetical protein ERX40_02600 [Macrococcus carouselicus]